MYLFFSSRRRHTIWPRDWSSDVCSSDLSINCENPVRYERTHWLTVFIIHLENLFFIFLSIFHRSFNITLLPCCLPDMRSEERRVGKESRCSWLQRPMIVKIIYDRRPSDG